jgi:hypothetical protein
VVFGKPSAAKRARDSLKRMAMSFVPDTRGRRKKQERIFPFDVKRYYFRQLFRIYHLRDALKSRTGGRKEKIKRASEDFDIPVDVITEFWGLDDAMGIQRGSGPYTNKDMARVLTARHFGITQHRVSNIIAS